MTKKTKIPPAGVRLPETRGTQKEEAAQYTSRRAVPTGVTQFKSSTHPGFSSQHLLPSHSLRTNATRDVTNFRGQRLA